jgi:hypothetical protein
MWRALSAIVQLRPTLAVPVVASAVLAANASATKRMLEAVGRTGAAPGAWRPAPSAQAGAVDAARQMAAGAIAAVMRSDLRVARLSDAEGMRRVAAEDVLRTYP